MVTDILGRGSMPKSAWHGKIHQTEKSQGIWEWDFLNLFLEKLAVISTIPFTLQFFVLHDEIRAFWFGIVGHYKYISLPVQQDYHKIFGALWTTHVLGVVRVLNQVTPDSGAYDLHSRAGACCAKGGGGKPANHGCWSPMEHGKPGGGFKCFSIFTPYTWGNGVSELPNKPPWVRCFDFYKGILPWWRCMRSSRKFQRLNIRCHVGGSGCFFHVIGGKIGWKWTISMASSKGCSNVWPLKGNFSIWQD